MYTGQPTFASGCTHEWPVPFCRLRQNGNCRLMPPPPVLPNFCIWNVLAVTKLGESQSVPQSVAAGLLCPGMGETSGYVAHRNVFF